MCGLFGYWGTPLPTNQIGLLRRVAHSQSSRGHDAFGIAWRVLDEKKSLGHMLKQSGDVAEHLGVLDKAAQAYSLIGHTRWTTHGTAACNANNHPHSFTFQNQKCWLAHNGVISSYRSIEKKFGLQLKTDCDSEVIARYIEESNGSILSRVKELVDEIDADAPFAMSAILPNGILLARRGNPLYWSESKSRCWFASTPHALCGKLHEIPDGSAYFIPSDDEHVESVLLKPMQHSRREWVGSTFFR